MRHVAVVALLTLLAGTAQASAATKVVSFDDLQPDTEVRSQYQHSHGVYFQGPDAGDGWFPVTRSLSPGLAHSGSQIADISTCTAVNCEGSSSRSVGTLANFATSVSTYVGYLGSDPSTATVTLTARDAATNPIASSSAVVPAGTPFNTLLRVTAPAMTSIAS